MSSVFHEAETALEASSTLEQAWDLLAAACPDVSEDMRAEAMTGNLGGDVFLPDEVPEPGSFREKFWTELRGDAA